MTVTLLTTNETRKVFQYGVGECVDEDTCRYVSRLDIKGTGNEQRKKLYVDLRLALEQIHAYIDSRKLEELIYYHKPQFTFTKSDVTLISQFTVNRLERFEQALGAWPGPVSAVIYLISPHDIDVLITYFSMDKNVYLYNRVDLTIVKPDYSNDIYLKYPINKLRNIGIEAAPTNYIFVMDADFVPTPRLYEFAVSYIVPQLQTLERPTVFIVPCVALVENYEGQPPRDISDLRRLYSNGWAYVTDPRAGHGPTGIRLLLSHPLKVSRPYYEVCYESQWEPYYILPKSAPMYDERFRNQGGDKQQHTLALNALKYRFLVLREHFIYHLDHAKLLWPGGGFKHAQLTEKEFTYFEHYIPEMEKKFGISVRWPRGCSRALFRDQMRDLVGIGVG
ncbi:8646_t:CDS:2 [Paraglomus brasilianum]|uniref:8646_t:CDS:1 n=1 Tax=Paraglomus brasilianum TaxID=144538 RepID=A0A9N8ZHB9_9GLOM|nr:8646_t:CDS:2 [Paraglomus brasilianum]